MNVLASYHGDRSHWCSLSVRSQNRDNAAWELCSALHHFNLTVVYIARLCLKIPQTVFLFRTATPLTPFVGFFFPPTIFSCSTVHHPPEGPNRGSRPHRHLSVRGQRKSSTRRLLAEGRKPGKSDRESNCVGIRSDGRRAREPSRVLRGCTHAPKHGTSNRAICHRCLSHTDTPLFSGAAEWQRALRSANWLPVTLR